MNDSHASMQHGTDTCIECDAIPFLSMIYHDSSARIDARVRGETCGLKRICRLTHLFQHK